MRRLLVIFSLMLSALLPAVAGAEKRLIAPAGFAVEPPKMKIGDDPQCARPEFDDAEWQRVPVSSGPPLLPGRAGPFWVRLRLEPTPLPDGRPRDAISLSIVAAYELYWDGRLIARNGVVGHDRESE